MSELSCLSTMSSAPKPDDATETRRKAILDAAVLVFARFGYRKTSMEEVARAAQLSRQGLYLHFANKEDLFRAGTRHLIETALEDAIAALDDEERPFAARLLGAYDAWVGRHVGVWGANAADVVEAANALVGPLMREGTERFQAAVTSTIRASKLMKVYGPAGLTAKALAETLSATAHGLKHSVQTREEFQAAMKVAVRALCARTPEAA